VLSLQATPATTSAAAVNFRNMRMDSSHRVEIETSEARVDWEIRAEMPGPGSAVARRVVRKRPRSTAGARITAESGDLHPMRQGDSGPCRR
jgi:carbon monoxide dehydrogenase subunit G